uniref:hypothetical protein n=1 Tax=Sinomonas sp. G460-2 TaxID=3393464 RepID=UPI0039EFD027
AEPAPVPASETSMGPESDEISDAEASDEAKSEAKHVASDASAAMRNIHNASKDSDETASES